jgi:transposase
MLGRHSPQGELFRPDSIHLEHVGRDSFYGFLARERQRMFRDEAFAGLYRENRGRPSVPPSQLCVALLLQAKDGVSDEEAIQRSAFDLRWKVALGIDLEEQLCAKSTLQLFRSKLVLHEAFGQVFQTSVDACKRAGLLGRAKLEVALDTTPILGRGAVKDTFNLISDQIVRVVNAVVEFRGLDRDALVAEHGLGRHFGSSFKGEVDLDWDDPEQKRALIGQLVADARVTLSIAKAAQEAAGADAEATRALRAAADLLKDLLLQDVDEEPADGQGPCVRQGTKSDRIVSTTDTEMRHGRKSSSKTFNGYKASVAVDVDDGVVLATDVIAANAHDAEGAGDLAAKAGERAGAPVATVLGDTAYGTSPARRDIERSTSGAEVIAKVPSSSKRQGVEFSLEDFEIDIESQRAVCPAGKQSMRYERPKGTSYHRFIFSRNDCNGCPVRAKCTTAKQAARRLTLAENYDELVALRAKQRTEEFKRTYRRRVKVEHRIARLVQLGVRQARYFGKAKTAYQVMLLGAVANLVLAARVLSGTDEPARRASGLGMAVVAAVLLGWTAVANVVAEFATSASTVNHGSLAWRLRARLDRWLAGRELGFAGSAPYRPAF